MKPGLLAWLQEQERPQAIWDLAESHPPDGEYKLASGLDDDLYVIHSYHEDGTMTVVRYSRMLGGPDSLIPMWSVFGMKPEDLVRTDEA